jgi:hypothetical protein
MRAPHVLGWFSHVCAVTVSMYLALPGRATPRARTPPCVGRPRPSRSDRGVVAPWPLWPQRLLPAVTPRVL